MTMAMMSTQLEDLTWRAGHSGPAGFGRLNLGAVLRLEVGLDPPPPPPMAPEDRCTCSADNARVWAAHPKWNASGGFPAAYGTECKAWHALPGGASCAAMFADDPAARPAPHEGGAATFDSSCCMPWCLVDGACASAIPWAAVPGLFYSFATCPGLPPRALAAPTCEFGERKVRSPSAACGCSVAPCCMHVIAHMPLLLLCTASLALLAFHLLSHS